MAQGAPQGEMVDPELEGGVEPMGRLEAEPLAYREMQRTYDGMGEISGEVFAADNLPFPDQWTLKIRPSRFALGRDLAISKDLEMPGNQSTFEVRDLPFAGYTVQAVAANQASPAMEVSLFRVEGGNPGASKAHSRVMLRFEPLSRLEVGIQDWEGNPASDLPVTVESKEDGKRWEAVTDGRGTARIEQLPEGMYLVSLGHPNRPLLPPAEVPVLRREPAFWQAQLPRTEVVRLKIVDDQAQPLPDAEVRGHGPTVFEARSDFDGMVVLPYLPHGTYQIRATHAQSEGTGQLTLPVPVPAHLDNPVLIYCRP
ncbi:MAG: carboxypeptidase regulatory-like domain-containing protein [Planctomycetes bacterium]|nr:carboxypeptidase regulatory-like domain-containing protein [Planctomycetota bacterium]MCB9912162.1 carboxypeptidase regulatory-like domain-containing protein [Planctomycetota bacterium]